MPQNVLFLLVDQWSAGALSCRGADFPTPNLDRLAAEGTLFTNAFTTCPLCSPARGTLLTGRWPHQTGMLDNPAGGYSRQQSLPLSQRTWIEEAVAQGFHVGYFGKWHLGSVNPEARGAHGFDPQVEVGRDIPYDPATNPYSYDRCRANYERARAGLVKGRPPFWGETRQSKEETVPFGIANNGVRFLQQWAAGERDRPFFLTVSLNPPHFPHYLPKEYARLADELSAPLPASIGDTFEGKPWFHGQPWWPCMETSVLDEDEWRTVIAYSRAHIMLVDEALGRVLEALDRLDLADSTTVVFASDHGDMEGAHNRFDKGAYFYDDVWRIPLVIRRPDTSPATQEAFVSLIDVGETLFRLASANERDDAPTTPRSGCNLLPLVGTGSRPADWSQQAYGVYDLYNGMRFAVRAIRNDRWKYVWNPQAVDELYDLDSDPHELTNLANQEAYTQQRKALREHLLNWLIAQCDPLPAVADTLPAAGTIVATGKPGP